MYNNFSGPRNLPEAEERRFGKKTACKRFI